MKKDEYEVRQQICETGRRIYERRMVASNDGNISVKLGDNEYLSYHRMESVEFYAELLYRTKQLGGGKELQGEELKKLYEVRKKTGLTGRHPFDAFIEGKKPECSCCGSCLFKRDPAPDAAKLK